MQGIDNVHINSVLDSSIPSFKWLCSEFTAGYSGEPRTKTKQIKKTDLSLPLQEKTESDALRPSLVDFLFL